MAVVICDLDGTLCDTRHRDHLAQAKRWNEYNADCANDKPHREVVEILKGLLAQGHEIAFVTGRSMEALADTECWIERNLFIPKGQPRLFMRSVGDFRSDVVVKREVYENHLKDEDILFVLEDRDRVVDMWRSLGLRCHQVQPGAY